MPVASAGGQAGHDGAHIVGHALGLIGMARGDEAMDRPLRRRKERSGRLACLAVGAAHPLDNEASRRVRIGGIAPRRRFQHRDEAFRDREIGFQQIEQRDRAGAGIAIENAAVELGLAAEGGIKARRVYPDLLRIIREIIIHMDVGVY